MEFSKITDFLLIGTTPRPMDYEILDGMGVRLVINMRFERPPFRPSFETPIRFLWLPTLDSPFTPVSIRVLKLGVKAALDIIENGGRVYAHCAEGIHRSIAMGSAILIAQGFSAENAMQLIKQKRPNADPYTWYIHRQIMHFARIWG
jgi:protein tyrosine phosphatase (PTP) superfamily phosphohydrolase (DUF442 family)